MTRAHNFSRKQRAELALRAKGCCELCSMRLKVGEGDADHILPVELGGESDIANGQWICKPCHKAKTAKDVGMMRKAESQRDRHTGAMLKTRNPIKSAGFPPRQPQKNRASAPVQKTFWREREQ